jgi:hypothetical protein
VINCAYEVPFFVRRVPMASTASVLAVPGPHCDPQTRIWHDMTHRDSPSPSHCWELSIPWDHLPVHQNCPRRAFTQLGCKDGTRNLMLGAAGATVPAATRYHACQCIGCNKFRFA